MVVTPRQREFHFILRICFPHFELSVAPARGQVRLCPPNADTCLHACLSVCSTARIGCGVDSRSFDLEIYVGDASKRSLIKRAHALLRALGGEFDLTASPIGFVNIAQHLY